MNRRAFVAGVVGGVLALAGCTTTGNTDEDPASAAERSKPPSSSKAETATNVDNGRITVDSVTVSPGETGTVSIDAKSVTELSVGANRSGPIRFDYDNPSFTPQPKSEGASSPPEWDWGSTPRNVSASVPFRIPADTRPGTYNYSVTISNGSDADTETGNFTLTVS